MTGLYLFHRPVEQTVTDLSGAHNGGEGGLAGLDSAAGSPSSLHLCLALPDSSPSGRERSPIPAPAVSKTVGASPSAGHQRLQ